MQPGLTRAVPMAILGFILGALFTIGLRALQSIEPVWDPQIGLITCAITVTWFFVWGMGAFNPAMSQHAHEPGEDDHADDHHAPAEEATTPTTILGYSIWQVATLTLVVLVAIFAYAVFGGGFVRTTNDPIGSAADIGFTPVRLPLSGDYFTWQGETVLFSELTLFAGFAIFTLLSLAVAGGILAGIFYALSRGMREVSGVQNSALLLSSGDVIEQKVAASRNTTSVLLSALRFVVAFIILYVLFYFILVGGLWLIFPTWPTWLRVVLSLVNALIFALIIVQPPFLMQPIGRVARGLAGSLRRVSSE
ncbi:MAG: hypothetical protein SF029_02015 [bacterium]|nr:hypothetical protein [bacterium]